MSLLILILATWRLTALFVYDDVLQWLRERARVHLLDENDRPRTFWGKVLGCFWCTSLLVGAILGLWKVLLPELVWVFLPFALSGAAILVNHLTRIHRDVRY